MRPVAVVLVVLLLSTGCSDDDAAGRIETPPMPPTTSAVTTDPGANDTPATVPPTTAAAGPGTTEAETDPPLLTGEMVTAEVGSGPLRGFASDEAYWVVDEGGNELFRVSAIRDQVLQYPLDTMSPSLGTLSAEEIDWWPSRHKTLAAFGAVWIQQANDDHIFRMDVSGRIDRIDLGGLGWSLFAGWDAIWHLSTSHAEDSEDRHDGGGEPIYMTISRIDPTTLQVTARLETPLIFVYDMVFLPGSAWIHGDTWDRPSELVRIDRATLDIRAWSLENEEGAFGFSAATGYVWMIGFELGLIRIDPDTGERTSFPLGEKPTEFAATEDSLWVVTRAQSNPQERELLRMDPTTGEIKAAIPIGRTIYEVVSVGQDVFVRTHDHNLYIDSLTNTAVDRPLAGLEYFAVIDNSLWAINPLDLTVWRFIRNDG